MKTIKLFSSISLLALLLTSCYVESVDEYNDTPTISLNQLLGSYDLWYVDINSTVGYGTTPFLQKAFTISFINGIVYANNNLVGIGSTGNGFGIDVGAYNAYDMVLDINHDTDGFETFDIYQINGNTIELYNPNNDTSYFLEGYQRSSFDYDFVFYDNIHYFLQEYDVWEKTFTSEYGALNEFDNENFLQFLAGGNDATFRSSQAVNGTAYNNLYWNYTGLYGIENVANNAYLKRLTLDYDYFDNEYFELSVINDAAIKLYHPNSGTVYEFEGIGYIQYLKTTNKSGKEVFKEKMRKARKNKVDNPRDKVRL